MRWLVTPLKMEQGEDKKNNLQCLKSLDEAEDGVNFIARQIPRHKDSIVSTMISYPIFAVA